MKIIQSRPWKCVFGLHSWKHLETHYLPTSYEAQEHFKITIVGRRIHYRECNECGKYQQYYPNPAPSRDNDIWYGEEQQCPWRDE